MAKKIIDYAKCYKCGVKVKVGWHIKEYKEPKCKIIHAYCEVCK